MDDIVKRPRKPHYKQDALGRWLLFEETTGRYVHNWTAALYTRWRKPIRQWLSHRVGKIKTSDLDDLAQEVFVRLLKYSTQTEIENPQGYVFRIAANIANEWAERVVNRNPHIDVEDKEIQYFEQLIVDVDPESVANEIDETNTIWAAVQQLPQRQRRILLRHIRDGRTYKQIAAERGISYRIVLRDLTRAYVHLRLIMKRSDFDGY
jgi:RNA polymerase sigma-70 factor (ECF subfamily)